MMTVGAACVASAPVAFGRAAEGQRFRQLGPKYTGGGAGPGAGAVMLQKSPSLAVEQTLFGSFVHQESVLLSIESAESWRYRGFKPT
jgi:hypothetical protein